MRRVCWKRRRKRISPSLSTLTCLRLKLNQRRQRLHGGGGGLVDALQKLLAAHQTDEWEDQEEVWLRRKLESLLSKKQSNGTLMTGLRNILQEAEAWQQQAQATAPKASRWKTSKFRSHTWEHQKAPELRQGPSTTGNAWQASQINKKQSSRWQKEHNEEWHQVKWRPRPQEFGDPGKVRIFCDVVDLSDHLDLMNDQMLDHGDLHVVFHADDEHAAQEASDILHVVPGMKASIFMTGRGKIKEQHEFPTWLENATWRRVAGHISQKLQVRAGWLCFIGHDGTGLARPKQTTTINLRHRIENSVVLRMILDRTYCRYWNTSNAGAQARAWCHAQSDQESIQDLVDKAFIKCMVRVANADVAETLMRASGTEQEGISYDIVMTRAVKTRRVQSKSTPLRNPKRMFLNLETSWQNNRPAAAPSIVQMTRSRNEMWDDEEEVNLEWNGPGDSTHVKPAQRERSPRRLAPVSVASHENIPEKWNRGGILMHNPGQGDCLFHALVQALAEKEPGKKRSHRQLRAFTVATMKNKAPVYEKKWDKTDSKGKETKMSFLEYVDSMAVPGTWSGKLEAQVLAEALQMRFLVHTSWDEILDLNPEAQDTACFYFDYHCGHWGFVKDADSNHWLRKKRTFSPDEVDPAAVRSLPRNDPDVPHQSSLILLLFMMTLLLHVPNHVEVAKILLSPLKTFRVPDCTRQSVLVKLIKRQ
eukprot:s46_g27.t1